MKNLSCSSINLPTQLFIERMILPLECKGQVLSEYKWHRLFVHRKLKDYSNKYQITFFRASKVIRQCNQPKVFKMFFCDNHIRYEGSNYFLCSNGSSKHKAYFGRFILFSLFHICCLLSWIVSNTQNGEIDWAVKWD